MFLLGELQWAHFHAAASVGGSGVSRAAGQSCEESQLSGADVLRGGLLRVRLLHHRVPHGKALQPAAGGDVRAGPPEGERLPLPLRAGTRSEPQRLSAPEAKVSKGQEKVTELSQHFASSLGFCTFSRKNSRWTGDFYPFTVPQRELWITEIWSDQKEIIWPVFLPETIFWVFAPCT